MADDFDILIIGGGINGCGIARDATGRGYSVCLTEMGDLASGTSSASTKLIHGGLRYLEQFAFRLVREALIEREILWAVAPHIIHPMRFVLPHHGGLRPAWLLRLGLFLYDHLGGRKRLPPTETIRLASDAAGKPLQSHYRKAFAYSDCWVDDARLVILNARDAADRGARILTRTKAVSARRDGDGWRVRLENAETGAVSEVRVNVLVNAAGPWADRALSIIETRAGDDDKRGNIRLVQGSHIVVPRLFEGAFSYIFQNADGRVVFAIPYGDRYTLIGTTDTDIEGDPAKAAITEAEIAYLCDAVNGYFETSVSPDDIVWSFSGVRPLYDEGGGAAQEASRDYVFRTEGREGEPLLVNIFGGKITTYRRLAEEVVTRIACHLGHRGAPWTEHAPLPGGDFPPMGRARLEEDIQAHYPFLDPDHVARLVRSYGTLGREVLGDAGNVEDLGRHFGSGLYEREVIWLMEREWAATAEDILWRRSKLGLRLDDAETRALAEFVSPKRPTQEETQTSVRFAISGEKAT